MIAHAYNALVDSVVPMNFKESFVNKMDVDALTALPATALASLFFTGLLLAAIQVLVVFLLWNNVAVKVLSVAKPMSSVWHALGLSILAALLMK